MIKKILVTGAIGQVGSSLQVLIESDPRYQGYFLTRQKFDLGDPKMMTKSFDLITPDLVINAAAYTQVDQAEEDQEMAQRINVDACEHLARLCEGANIPIIHFSSDYVYHNGLDRPLVESDPLDPKSVYARTKKLGEDKIRNNASRHFILRTSWVYDAFGTNFVRTMLSLSKRYPELTVVDDQVGSPTYAPDIAKISLLIASAYFENRLSTDNAGIYNFSNEGVCSWYDFAKAIFELSRIEIKVKPVPSSAFPRPAARPHYSVMNKSKIRALFPEAHFPQWRESLQECLDLISQSELT